MLSTKHARIMLELQAGMNAKINPEWLAAGYAYLRAVVVEGAEAMEHHGWKWWKKQYCDLEQLQMELIDIWHFTLSYVLLESRGDFAKAQSILCTADNNPESVDFDGKPYVINALDLISKLELLIGLSVSRRIHLPLFESIMADCKMDWNELFCQYVGKNVLNFFRQDHGYKEGTYQKIWKGREDNEHLVEIMSELDHDHEEFQHQLYINLKDRYDRS